MSPKASPPKASSKKYSFKRQRRVVECSNPHSPKNSGQVTPRSVASIAAASQRLYPSESSPQQAIMRLNYMLKKRVNGLQYSVEDRHESAFPSLESEKKTTGDTHAPTIPKTNVLENWLDKTLQRSGHRLLPMEKDSAHETAWHKTHTPALSSIGLDRKSMSAKGIPKTTIDRIYRAMYVYSAGFHEVLREIANFSANESIVTSMWMAFSHLIEECEEDQYNTGIQAIARENRKIVHKMKAAFEEKMEHAEARYQKSLKTICSLKVSMEKEVDNACSIGKERDKLKDQLNSLKSSHLQLFESKCELDVKYEELDDMAGRQDAKLHEYANIILDLETKMSLQKQQVTTTTSALEALRGKAKRLEGMLASTRESLKNVSESLKTTGEQKIIIQTSLSEARLELSTVKQTCADGNIARAKLEKELLTTRSAASALGNQLDTKTIESDKLKHDLAELTREYNEETFAKSIMRTSLERAESEVKLLKEKLYFSEESLLNVKEEKAQGDNTIDKLSSDVTLLTKTCNKLRASNSDLTMQLEVASMNLTRQNLTTERNETEMAARRKRINSLESKLKQCKKDILERDTRLEEMEQMLEKLEEEAHDSSRHSRAQKMEYEKTISELEEKNRLLDVEKNAEIAQRMHAEEKLKEFATSYGEQSRNMGKKMAEYDACQSDLESTKRRLLVSERLLSKCRDALELYKSLCEGVCDSVARLAIKYAEQVGTEYHMKQKEALDVANIEAMRVVKDESNRRGSSVEAVDVDMDDENIGVQSEIENMLNIAPSLSIRMGIISLAESNFTELYTAYARERKRHEATRKRAAIEKKTSDAALEELGIELQKAKEVDFILTDKASKLNDASDSNIAKEKEETIGMLSEELLQLRSGLRSLYALSDDGSSAPLSIEDIQDMQVENVGLREHISTVKTKLAESKIEIMALRTKLEKSRKKLKQRKQEVRTSSEERAHVSTQTTTSPHKISVTADTLPLGVGDLKKVDSASSGASSVSREKRLRAPLMRSGSRSILGASMKRIGSSKSILSTSPSASPKDSRRKFGTTRDRGLVRTGSKSRLPSRSAIMNLKSSTLKRSFSTGKFDMG